MGRHSPRGDADLPSGSESVLVVAVGWFVRVVVLVFVLPVRLGWDVLVAVGREFRRWVWLPAFRVLAWLDRMLVAARARWLWRVLAPAGYWLRARLGWLGTRLVVRPGRWLHRLLLTPLGRAAARLARRLGNALAWLGSAVFAGPWAALIRYVLAPAGRAIAVLARRAGATLWICWQIAGRVLRKVLVDPAVWVWRHAVRPAGLVLRDHVWRPVAAVFRSAAETAGATIVAARAALRQARADVRRTLAGWSRGRP